MDAGSPPRTALVVDDHAAFRAAAARVLGAAGYDVVASVATGEDGVTAADRHRPALALVDVRLPGIDGIATTRRLLAASPATVVVLCSTLRAEDLPRGAATCGARRFLRKDELSVAAIDALDDRPAPPA